MGPVSIALERGGRLVADARQSTDRTEVSLELDGIGEPCILHWGVRRGSHRWLVPPQSEWPAGSWAVDGAAVETPFPATAGRARLTIALGAPPGYTTLDFVLFFPTSGRWDNNHGRDYHVSLADAGNPTEAGSHSDNPAEAGSHGAVSHGELSREIVEGETGNHGWTLMHRFNLCYDLLDRVPAGDTEGLALLFVWLRFSAIRQLDWQRNYNTQPRELAHAQDRLTLKLAERFARQADERAWIRLIMGTVGRGGEGQRVRDEVLNIMHRHHIKEVSGHFMEEWHQKLHNNTTPDDVAICEAYLAFLRSDGDRDGFYRTLEAAGVTRARLRSYERPITSEPDFIPGLKGALIHDFEEFLRILNRLHSGTDLGAAIEDAGAVADGPLAGIVDWIWQHRSDTATPVDALVARITEARNLAAERLASMHQAGPVRALVYLDLALEQQLRLAIERQLQASLSADHLVTLIALGLENVRLAAGDGELRMCERQWERLRTIGQRDRLWALRADAAGERIARAIAALLDRYQLSLQGRAEALGHAFRADAWAIASFSEEVIRGRPAVVVPVLTRLLRADLRRQHRLPPWQIVSGGRAGGELRVVDALDSIQGARFARSTIILADRVSGQEEIPIGVSAVVTPQDVDVLSHVGIRARNAGVLFAACHDIAEIDRLKALAGHAITLTVTASGELSVQEGGADEVRVAQGEHVQLARGNLLRAGYVVTPREFTEGTVGAKARTLVRLEGKLPPWIRLPPSLAIPFGAFERALDEAQNADAARRYRDLIVRLEAIPADDVGQRKALLDALRRTIVGLAESRDMLEALRGAFEQAHLAWPAADRVWSRVKQVWASKWNERAFFSREANGIDHESVVMAVLVQPVIEADYAFVIHTANPSTGARDEIHAQMVLGLGEALVGNYPGRALGFTWRRRDATFQLTAFPSKSAGLFGGGLIFRSDSNAEDLTGYAAAGLYDSVMLTPPREELLDYAREPLVWDDEFRQRIMSRVAEIGVAVERALGPPQDIEGARVKDEWYVLQARPQIGLRGA